MSSEPDSPQARHLAEYLRLLMAGVERFEPDRAAAIRSTAGSRRARIVLGDEAATIGFKGERFVARRSSPGAAGRLPSGATDRRTVVAILTGFLEVSEAISDGRLDFQGASGDVIDMCAVIEMLIDSSTRIPGLQQLALAFRRDPRTGPFAERRRLARQRARRAQTAQAEAELLHRCGLV